MDCRAGDRRWRPAGGEPRSALVRLSAFTLCRTETRSRWRHAIRGLDPQGRLRVHEVVDLAGFDGRSVVVTLRRCHWEIRAGGPAFAARPVDAQRRVLVPPGVRHHLGLDGQVVVSLATDGGRIVVWAADRLDGLVEDGR